MPFHHVKIDIDRNLAGQDEIDLLKTLFTMIAFQYDCDFDLEQLEEGDELTVAFDSAAEARSCADQLRGTALGDIEGIRINAPRPLS